MQKTKIVTDGKIVGSLMEGECVGILVGILEVGAQNMRLHLIKITGKPEFFQ